MSRSLRPPPECAQCGADIPPHARACPECGADERTGWRESSVYDGLELPEDESSAQRAARPPTAGIPWYWWAVAVGLLLLLGLGTLGLN